MKLNAEVDTAAASRYRVRAYPTILVLQKDGGEVDRVVGYYRAPEFMALVEDYLAGRNTLASLLGEEPAKRRDPAFQFALGDRLADHGLFKEARARLERVAALDSENRTGKADDALYRLARMSRKDKEYKAARRYAQIVLDRYPESDQMKAAMLEVGINLRREGALAQARKVFLDYVRRFPQDEDAPWARHQADSLASELRRPARA